VEHSCSLPLPLTQPRFGDCFQAAHPHCAQNASPTHKRWLLRTKSAIGSQQDACNEIYCDEHVDIALDVEKTHANRFCFDHCVSLLLRPQVPVSTTTTAVSATKAQTLTQAMLDESDSDGGGGARKLLGGAKRKFAKKNKRGERGEDGDGNDGPLAKIAKIKRGEGQRRLAAQFMDVEAGIDSGDSGDEFGMDDDSLGSLEDFINDGDVSVDRGLDSLDSADPHAQYRKVDIMEESGRFTTPRLRRRRRTSEGSQLSGGWSATSVDGLGDMHFIKSVIDHHNRGGEARELEEAYHYEEEDSEAEEAAAEEERAAAYQLEEEEEEDSDFEREEKKPKLSKAELSEIAPPLYSVHRLHLSSPSFQMVSQNGTNVYSCKVTSWVTKRRGGACVRVESLPDDSQRWSEWVRLDEWKER